MKRLAKFVRSLIPDDAAQLIFLAGVVCLTVAPHLRWWPQETTLGQLGWVFNRQVFNEQFRAEWAQFVVPAIWPIIFAAMAGYFVCFWPGSRPFQRIVYFVCFPAVFGLSLICGRFLYISRQPASVFESASDKLRSASSSLAVLWSLGPGLHFCMLGILLIFIFVARLASGKTSLPLQLLEKHPSGAENAALWRRLEILTWVLVGPLFLFVALPSILAVTIPYIFKSPLSSYVQSIWFLRLSPIIGTLAILGITSLILGREGKQVVWRLGRMPKPKYLLLGLSFPIGISMVVSIGNYLFDRVQWAAQDFGRYSPPQFETYFDFPDPWLLLLFSGAFVEEIIFRGLLQPRFIQRYGLYRGIFLVGIVWSAFHFSTDSYSGSSDLGVLLRLAFRIFMCLALGFVFGWLTLRSGSVLPAAVAHTFYNVLVDSGSGPYFPGMDTVRVGLWAVLAYVLFRYLPVRAEDEPEADGAVPQPEPVP